MPSTHSGSRRGCLRAGSSVRSGTGRSGGPSRSAYRCTCPPPGLGRGRCASRTRRCAPSRPGHSYTLDGGRQSSIQARSQAGMEREQGTCKYRGGKGDRTHIVHYTGLVKSLWWSIHSSTCTCPISNWRHLGMNAHVYDIIVYRA